MKAQEEEQEAAATPPAEPQRQQTDAEVKELSRAILELSSPGQADDTGGREDGDVVDQIHDKKKEQPVKGVAAAAATIHDPENSKEQNHNIHGEKSEDSKDKKNSENPAGSSEFPGPPPSGLSRTNIAAGSHRVGAFQVGYNGRRRAANNNPVQGEEDVETGQDTSTEEFQQEEGNGMLLANLVTREELHEEFRSELIRESIVATPLDEKEQKDDIQNRSTNYKWMVLGAIIVAVGVFLAIFFSVREEGDDDELPGEFPTLSPTEPGTPTPTMSPTPMPTLSGEQETLLVYLKTISPDGGVLLEDIDSPQYQAFLWLSSMNMFTPSNSLNETYALVTMYHATDGDNWINNKNWLESEDTCEWATNSPATQCLSGRWVWLDIPSNNLRGSLPREIGLLSSLHKINLEGNYLEGALPPELFSGTKGQTLRTLNLGGNSFTGSLPPEVGRLTLLEELRLEFNRIKGPLPTEIGNLANLIVFTTERCVFTGTIPSEIGRLGRLEEWDMRLAALSGTIPETIGSMSSLRHIDFAGLLSKKAGFNGTSLPEGLYDLTQLTNLQLIRCGLGGTISSQIGKLTNLRVMQYLFNEFTGTLPSEIGLLTDLAIFEVGKNFELGGRIPSEIGNLTRAGGLMLDSCNFTGSIPTEVGLMESLTTINLDYSTLLTGTVPTEIAELPNLQHFKAPKCALTGQIPSEFLKMTTLKTLNLLETKLTGSLPSTSGLWTSTLEVFGIGNGITGTIPSEIGLATNLLELYLHSNELVGEIPTEFGLLTSLRRLILSDNSLSSTLPTELGQLIALEDLRVQNNQLSAMIPAEIGNAATELDISYFDGNNFVGEVPLSFCGTSDLYADCEEVDCPCCTYCCNNSSTNGTTCLWVGEGEDTGDDDREINPFSTAFNPAGRPPSGN